MKKTKLMMMTLILLAIILLAGCSSNDETLELNPVVTNQVRYDYYNQHLKLSNPNFSFEELEVSTYFGTFNGSVVIMFNTPSRQMIGQVVIANIEINFADSRRILVWNEGIFYGLGDAFEGNLLTIEDIRLIADIQNYNVNV